MHTLTTIDPFTQKPIVVEVEDLVLSYHGGPPECAKQVGPDTYRLGRVTALVDQVSPPTDSEG
jgi:hypothetical protein